MKSKIKLLSVSSLLALVAILPSCNTGKVVESNQEDPTKANITVATFDGGVGYEWIQKSAKEFEELYKDATNFQEGRVGVKVNVVASKSYTGGYLQDSSLNKDIYFTESVDYINVANTGKVADLTGILSEKLSEYGEDKSILDKIDENFKNFLNRNGSYYAVPFYDAFYGFVYDVDLWKEEKLYFSTAGSFTNDLTNLSNGPDGLPNTIDDGMPATYEDFSKLLKKMTDNDINPIAYSSKYDEYVMRTLTNFWSNHEGLEQTQLNYSFSGKATDLVKSINADGTPVIEEKDITFDNGYDLQRQAGKLHALDFLQNIVCVNPQNCVSASTHTGAQSNFIESKHYGKPFAMLVDGSWWENEAVEAFTSLERGNFERSNYRIMPIPHVDESHIGNKQTILSQNASYGVVAQNSSNLELALKFMQFLHTDKQLSSFTATTSVTRSFEYDVTEEDTSKVTSYGYSLIDLKKNNNVVYPYSSLPQVINNADRFTNDTWAWTSSIDGMAYNDPFKYFTQTSEPSHIKYFNGIFDHYHASWSNINR